MTQERKDQTNQDKFNRNQNDPDRAAQQNRDQFSKQQPQPRRAEQPQQAQGGREQNKQADGQRDRLGGKNRQDQSDQPIPMQDRSGTNSEQSRK